MIIARLPRLVPAPCPNPFFPGCIVADLVKQRKAAPAYLCTPTDAHVVPAAAMEHSGNILRLSPLWQQLLAMVLKGPKAMRPNGPRVVWGFPHPPHPAFLLHQSRPPSGMRESSPHPPKLTANVPLKHDHAGWFFGFGLLCAPYCDCATTGWAEVLVLAGYDHSCQAAEMWSLGTDFFLRKCAPPPGGCYGSAGGREGTFDPTRGELGFVGGGVL